MINWTVFLRVLEVVGTIAGLVSAIATLGAFIMKRGKLTAIFTCSTLICTVIVALLFAYTPRGDVTRAGGPGTTQSVTIAHSTTGGHGDTVTPTASATGATIPKNPTATNSIPTFAVPTITPTVVAGPSPTSTPVPPQTSLDFCGLCTQTQLQSICNSGNPSPFVAYGDLLNQTNNVGAKWTLYFTPSGWTATPSSGALPPSGDVEIEVSSSTGLFPGQTLTAHFTCDDGSGTPCQVNGWQSAGPC